MNQIQFVEKYLALLKVEDRGSSRIDMLYALQKSHIQTLSWNTIDLFLKRNIKLEPTVILQKYVTEQPGGVCYELNGAFCYLLKQLEFDAYLASAFVYGHNDNIFNFEIDTHVVIIVEINKQLYLVDVGWGNFYRRPVILTDENYFSDMSGAYRLTLEKLTSKYRLEKHYSGQWRLQYIFSLENSALTAFNHNLATIYTHPKHEMHRQINCLKSMEEGYFSLKNDKIISCNNGYAEEFSLEQLGGIRAVLKKQFNMDSVFVDSHF